MKSTISRNPAFNWENNYRGVMRRQNALALEYARAILKPGEMCMVLPDADGTGSRLGVASTERPEELLRRIRKAAFPSFVEPDIVRLGPEYWMHLRAL